VYHPARLSLVLDRRRCLGKGRAARGVQGEGRETGGCGRLEGAGESVIDFVPCTQRREALG